MTLSIVLQFAVVLAAIWMGARFSGVGLGLWGAVGLLVLVVAFGVSPTSPPVDVMLIILAVIMVTWWIHIEFSPSGVELTPVFRYYYDWSLSRVLLTALGTALPIGILGNLTNLSVKDL